MIVDRFLRVAVAVDQPGRRAGKRHDEHDGAAHADSGIELLGYAQEGADPEELHQNVVLGEDHYENDREDLCHPFAASFFSLLVQESAMAQPPQPSSPQPISGSNFLPCLARPQTSSAIMAPNIKNPPGV